MQICLTMQYYNIHTQSNIIWECAPTDRAVIPNQKDGILNIQKCLHQYTSPKGYAITEKGSSKTIYIHQMIKENASVSTSR